MEVMQDTCAKVTEFIWGGWDKWGAQEGSQYAEMTQGGNSQGRGSDALYCPTWLRDSGHPTSKDTAC